MGAKYGYGARIPLFRNSIAFVFLKYFEHKSLKTILSEIQEELVSNGIVYQLLLHARRGSRSWAGTRGGRPARCWAAVGAFLSEAPGTPKRPLAGVWSVAGITP